MKLLIILLAFTLSAICYGQPVPGKTDSIPPKSDSVTIIVNEIAEFSYDKTTAKDFDLLKAILTRYLQQKEFTKPKKK